MKHLNNALLYDGSHNYLSNTITWICNYPVQLYPFDLLTCLMEFNLGKQNAGFAKHLPINLTYGWTLVQEAAKNFQNGGGGVMVIAQS